MRPPRRGHVIRVVPVVTVLDGRATAGQGAATAAPAVAQARLQRGHACAAEDVAHEPVGHACMLRGSEL